MRVGESHFWMRLILGDWRNHIASLWEFYSVSSMEWFTTDKQKRTLGIPMGTLLLGRNAVIQIRQFITKFTSTRRSSIGQTEFPPCIGWAPPAGILMPNLEILSTALLVLSCLWITPIGRVKTKMDISETHTIITTTISWLGEWLYFFGVMTVIEYA